jgi:hypothetical protein
MFEQAARVRNGFPLAVHADVLEALVRAGEATSTTAP